MKNKNRNKSKAIPLTEGAPSREGKVKENTKADDEKMVLTGYPIYPPAEDIYNHNKEVDVDPEEISKLIEQNVIPELFNETDFREDSIGFGLDVPGSELDDALEKIGSEDEENNYYSLGGDNHNDLEEDKGE